MTAIAKKFYLNKNVIFLVINEIFYKNMYFIIL